MEYNYQSKPHLMEVLILTTMIVNIRISDYIADKYDFYYGMYFCNHVLSLGHYFNKKAQSLINYI